MQVYCCLAPGQAGLQSSPLGAPCPGPKPAASVIWCPICFPTASYKQIAHFSKPSALSPQAGGAARRAGQLDVDEGSLVAVGRLGLHAAPLPPCDPAVPVELGIAAQP